MEEGLGFVSTALIILTIFAASSEHFLALKKDRSYIIIYSSCPL